MNQLQGKTVGMSRKRSERNRKSACCFPDSTADVLLERNDLLCGFIAVASEITGLSLDSPGQYSHSKLAGFFKGFFFFFIPFRKEALSLTLSVL